MTAACLALQITRTVCEPSSGPIAFYNLKGARASRGIQYTAQRPEGLVVNAPRNTNPLLHTVHTHAEDSCVLHPSGVRLHHGCESAGEDDGQIAKAVEAIAELALLGAGDIDKLFPESLDEAYAAYGADEMEWRIVL